MCNIFPISSLELVSKRSIDQSCILCICTIWLVVLRPNKCKDKTTLQFFNFYFYRPQTKFAKVMFLQVCLSTGGGVHGGGGLGVCVVAGGMHGGEGLGGMHGGGGMRDGRGGHVWWWGGCMGYNEIRSMSGQYAPYWNAFLFTLNSHRSTL